MKYWQERMAKSQQVLIEKNIKQIEKQIRKYYLAAAQKCINDFETVYEKLLSAVGEGREPTPADLYKLDKYWEAQSQLKSELQKLGDKEIEMLSAAFEKTWFDIYSSIVLPNTKASMFNLVDNQIVKQMIGKVWCADGKSWSQRIWANTEDLAQMLNDELIHCVTTGKKTTDLKKLLQERFGVSYTRADALVRTEVAHIQTEAAKQRYEDYGIQMVEIWADEDERRCEVCGKLHQKKYRVGEQVPIPAHPRCRCCIVPVVD